jgi:hypothetical protein
MTSKWDSEMAKKKWHVNVGDTVDNCIRIWLQNVSLNINL